MPLRKGTGVPRAAEARGGGDSNRPADLLGEVIDALSEGLAIFDENAALVRCNEEYRRLNPLVADLVRPGLAWDLLLRELAVRAGMGAAARDRLQWMEARLADGDPHAQPLQVEFGGGQVHEIVMRLTATGGFVLVQRDVTERVRMAAMDREADTLLREVLEACPASLVMARVGDGRIIYRSPAATELLGTTRHSQDHFASREERADFITALLPDGHVDEMTITAIRSDGSRFPCLLSARLIEYRGDEVVVSSMVDISKEVGLRRTLAEQREQLFQTEKMSALGELLAGVAHELNNPLSVVVGHAMMLREQESDPAIRRRIGKITEAAGRCAAVVQSFLAMAREQPVRSAALDLGEAVAAAVENLRQGAGGLTVDVQVQLPDDLPTLQGDLQQLTQVMINLLANADQAIAQSGVGGRVRVSARGDADAGFVEIRVDDDGPGIPAEIRRRVFEPLFTTKGAGQGTGIGLAFCQRVVHAHGGTITVADSEAGATFVVRLPVARQPEVPRPAESSPQCTGAVGRVLVIDDEPDVANLIREILVHDGFTVDCVTDAEAGLALLETRSYAIVLTDLNMPGVSGREFYERVAGEHPGLAARIGFVTGDAMNPAVRSFLDRSGRPFLEKPVAPEELRRLARSMIGPSAAAR